MTVLTFRDFSGEIPRQPADRLPEGAALLAQNCDLNHGELRSLAGLGAAFTTAVTPVRGLFTDDGLRFFVWDKPTRAYLHPTIDDTVGRVIYQTHGQGVRVALLSDMTVSSLSPGSPPQSWKAGVKAPPAPVLASTLTLGGALARSTDGVSWSYADSPFPDELPLFGFSIGTAMLVFGDGGSLARSTDDGVTWALAAAPLGGALPNTALCNGTIMMAVGAAGAIVTSDATGAAWTTRDSGLTTDLYALTYSPTLWVAAGASGKLVTSNDSGATWTTRAAAFSTTAIRALHCDELFVAVGDAGKISTSANGTAWTARASGFDASTIRLVTKANGVWVVAGDDGKIATSPDGVTWTLRTSPFGASRVRKVLYAGATWVAMADDGKLAYSTDNAATWTLATVGLGTLYGVVHTGTQWVAVGEQGVSTSPDVITWTARLGVAISTYRYVAATPGGAVIALGEMLATGTETIAIVAVAVNEWGEESAPSEPLLIEKGEAESYTVSVTHTPDADERSLSGIVFYRTYASNQSSDYYLLNETPIAGDGGVYTHTDSTTEVQSTTVLQTASWDTPPADAGNLTYMGNGFFVLSAGKDLVFSEPYRPHAWPYRMTLPHGVVGIVAVEGGVLVTTQAQPYLIGGSHPSQVSQQLLPVEQAGWSDTAMVRADGSAIYASNDGLVAVFGGQPSLTGSQRLFARSDWRAAYGAVRQNLRLAAHDARVLGFVDPAYPSAPGESRGAFLISLDEAGGSFSRLDVGVPIYGACLSATTDELYLGTATGAVPFGTGSDLALTWRSGDVLYPAPVSFAAAVIDCAGSFTVEIYADGTLAHTQAVTGKTSFRLPPIAPAERWSVKFTGTGTVRKFDMAAAFAELRGI